MNLTIIESKEALTSRFLDYSNVVLLPAICLFGMATSLVCILASWPRRRRRTDESNVKIFNYILINSSVDFVFLFTQFFSVIVRCGSLCPYGYSYASKVYEIYVFWLVGYSVINAQVLFSVYVSYDRLKLFSNSIDKNKTSLYLVFAACLTLGTCFNIPSYAFSKDVVLFGVFMTAPNTTELLYKKIVRDEFLSPVWQNILAVLLVVKDPVMFLVLCGVNFLVCLRFREYLKKKNSLVNENLSSNLGFFKLII